MSYFKKLIFTIFLLLIVCTPCSFAANNTRNDLHIIPEASEEGKEKVKEVISNIGDITAPGTVIDRYNQQAQEIDEKGDLGSAFSSGVFTRRTIINYLSYLMKFLSQIGLLIGGIMVLRSGYQYATVIFKFGDPNNAKTAISSAIKGILIIIFSYAIFGLLSSMFIK